MLEIEDFRKLKEILGTDLVSWIENVPWFGSHDCRSRVVRILVFPVTMVVPLSTNFTPDIEIHVI